MYTEKLQEQIRALRKKGKPISLHYSKGYSNTTRSKQYKTDTPALACGPMNQILSLDLEKRNIRVQPRVTMEELVKATLPHGLIPAIVPEFKGITVGGALMGAAAESASHQWGIFHDLCDNISLLDGEGTLIQTSPTQNPDLFYGLSGSYGSLGIVVSADLSLIPASPSVHLVYHIFSEPHQALKKLESLIGKCDFLDGIIYSRQLAVIIEGKKTVEPATPSPLSRWYAHSVQSGERTEEIFPLYDYLFRYDQGAFWMGSFLFSFAFLYRYLGEGILKLPSAKKWFNEKEIELFRNLSFPGTFARTATAPLMSSQRLWSLLHKAEKWVQDRLVIQDVCIPQSHASTFLSTLLNDPGVFPIWLCPIKGTETPQHFAPHYGRPLFINFGLYGVPSYSAPMEIIIQRLENRGEELGGRKVLYSRSYYSEADFWRIYPRNIYESLRKKTHAEGVWRGLTEKVLSE